MSNAVLCVLCISHILVLVSWFSGKSLKLLPRYVHLCPKCTKAGTDDRGTVALSIHHQTQFLLLFSAFLFFLLFLFLFVFTLFLPTSMTSNDLEP